MRREFLILSAFVVSLGLVAGGACSKKEEGEGGGGGKDEKGARKARKVTEKGGGAAREGGGEAREGGGAAREGGGEAREGGGGEAREGGGEGSGGDEGVGVVAGLGGAPKEVALGAPLKEKNYHLTLTGPGELKKGETKTLVLTLVPQKPYKANKLFPFSLKVTKASKGLGVAKRDYKKKDAASFGPKKVVFEMKVKAAEKGDQTLEAFYKFSVCTPKFCETPKAVVKAKLKVK